MKLFAFAHPSNPKCATAYCEDMGKRPDGGRKFSVINGAWSGYLKDGMIYFDTDGHDPHPAIIVWEGETPPCVGGYNFVLPWINEQIGRAA